MGKIQHKYPKKDTYVLHINLPQHFVYNNIRVARAAKRTLYLALAKFFGFSNLSNPLARIFLAAFQ
ncbi:hypothetical protein, partial [Ligilactobacillus salivarius]|uniref:hypothetical protein n=1 Tax=Ligilactobacillus salivarius TaxID=1624 RepID=UPI001CDAF2D9